jgi:predicted N-acetyltransferase YhbS
MRVIREEIPEDYEAIGNLNRLAFGGNEEAVLVDRLRSNSI